jgi:SAM-dependent methyltransferase
VTSDASYYRRDLAVVHHRGFGFHADRTAPAILDVLRPVREHGGLVVELGCGSGLLTRHLTEAGHRVVATDASPAMLELAREHAPDAEIRELRLPDDPIPQADAVVSVGHVLSYLPDEKALDRALVAAAEALRPGGVLVLDLCDLAWGESRRNAPAQVHEGDGWLLVSRFAVPTPDRFVREMTTFTRTEDGTWRRDDERHDNVLIDTSRVPALLAEHGVEAEIRSEFGTEPLPTGLVFVVGQRTG